MKEGTSSSEALSQSHSGMLTKPTVGAKIICWIKEWIFTPVRYTTDTQIFEFKRHTERRRGKKPVFILF